MDDAEAGIEIACARCEKAAARYAALRAGQGRGLLHDHDRVLRTGFIGECELPRPYDEALATIATLRAGGLPRLYHDHGDFYALLCGACGLPYCLARAGTSDRSNSTRASTTAPTRRVPRGTGR